MGKVDESTYTIFIPIYLLEITVSIIALLMTLKNRMKILNKSLYEQMIINIMIADLVFNIAHGLIFISVEQIFFLKLEKINIFVFVGLELLGMIAFSSA
jgi:hypothetical protein